jgi:hypothetical protein
VICSAGPVEESATVQVFENSPATLNFTVAQWSFDSATDNYGYFGYEVNDPGASAEYDWLEISPNAGGPGALVAAGTGNDWVTNVTTPFPVRFYGAQSTTVRIGADGWVGVGTGSNGTRQWVNQPIPTDSLPNNIIALFWDDLLPGPNQADPDNGSGDISWYHDAANGRMIIEWRDVAHFNPTTNRITGQIIIYSQAARPTLTGDNELILQYQDLDYADSVDTDVDGTIGIENAAGNDGIQVVFNGSYNLNCVTVGPQYAIRFTTGEFAGYGVVRGQLTMHPAPPDYTLVTIAVGGNLFNPLANGSFLQDSINAATYTASVNFAGYELFSQPNVVIAEDETTTVNIELWRLDPARNLSGNYDWQTTDITLHWDPALSTRDPLTAFIGYEINLAGRGIQDTVPDTFYVYDVTQSRAYNFWLRALYGGGVSDTSNHYRVTVDLATEDEVALIPNEFYLAQNYPNPFNPTTTIEYGLPRNSHVVISVYNILGMKVGELINGDQTAGIHRTTFDGLGLATGIYYARLDAGDFTQMRKMLLLK